jgi:ornithine cyclodeaminase/alanine dehydrogenase-like protein (mu-crystallin family)
VKVLIISQSEVPALLPMGACIEVMRETFRALAAGEALLPLRTITRLPERDGLLVTMPAYLGPTRSVGLKMLTIFPENHGTEIDAHQGAVVLCEAERGRLLAVLDATSITAIRTAAVSGLATRLLARADAGDLAILGSGVQAESHLEAMLAVRPIRRVRVWSRTAAHAASFARRMERRWQLPVKTAVSAQEAVAGADLVCAATAAVEPVLFGEWLSPGAHINSVGVAFPGRELAASVLQRARLFCDRRESLLHESGDFRLARDEGAVGDSDVVGELAELVAGSAEGRRTGDEITLFKSLGLAIEDLAAARYIYERAVAEGRGTAVELGGDRHITT